MAALFKNNFYCLGCIVLLISLAPCLLSDPVGTPSSFIDVFSVCIQEINMMIIPADSETMEFLFTITQSESIFRVFLDCMDYKMVHSFRDSNDSTEWYLARVFDSEMVGNMWNFFSWMQSHGHNYTCLTSEGHMDEIEQCLRQAILDIEAVRQNTTSQLDILLNSDFKDAVCRELNATFQSTPMDCLWVLNNNSCPPIFKTWVSTFFVMTHCVSPTQRNSSSEEPNQPNSTLTPPSTQSSTSSNPTLLPSLPENNAFTNCQLIVFGVYMNFTMLYPPTESSLGWTGHEEEALRQHMVDINSFCSKVDQYTQCVTLKFLHPMNNVDRMLKQYVGVDTLSKAFAEFCANKELVINNFECTFRATMINPQCKGGMNDVMRSLYSMTREWDLNVCSQLKSSRECRLIHQLRPCGEEYAMVMEGLLTGVLSEQCRAGKTIIPDNEMTDVLSCLGEHVVNVTERVSAEFTNKLPDVYSMVEFGLTEVESLCSEEDAIFACISIKLKSSTKTADIFVKTMFSTENLFELLGYLCDMMPDLKTNTRCLVNNFNCDNCMVSLSDNVTECISKLGQEEVASMGYTTLNQHTKTDIYCITLRVTMRCIMPILSGCEENLVSKYNKLIDGIHNSCNNFSYTLELRSELKPGPTSGSEFSHATLPYISGMFILLSYIVYCMLLPV